MLLAAAGLTTFAGTRDLSKASGVEYGALVFGAISVVLSLVSVVLWRSVRATMTPARARSWLATPVAEVEARILMDKLEELQAQVRDLEMRNSFLIGAMVSLVSSWALALIAWLPSL